MFQHIQPMSAHHVIRAATLVLTAWVGSPYLLAGATWLCLQ